MHLINVQDMPAPRLELRWRKTGDDWSHRECDYNLVIPLGAHDVRRDVYDDWAMRVEPDGPQAAEGEGNGR